MLLLLDVSAVIAIENAGNVDKRVLPPPLAEGKAVYQAIKPSLHAVRRNATRPLVISPILSILLGNDGVPKIIDRTLFVNPTDARLYSLSLDNGEQYTLFGDRDATGKATTIRMIEYSDKGGNTVWVHYDQSGLPVKVVSDEDLSIGFQYAREATKGETQTLAVTATVSQPGYSDVQAPLPVSVTAGVAVAKQQAEDPTGNLTINVSKCGTPVTLNNNVYVDFRNGIGQHNVQRYPAFKTSQPGVFIASVPQRRSTDAQQEPTGVLCNTVADSIDKVCRLVPSVPNVDTQTVICSALGTALNAIPAMVTSGASLTATLPVTDKVFFGCLATIKIGENLCGSLGYSPDPNWSIDNYQNDNSAQYLCNKYHKIKDPVLGLDKVSIKAYTEQIASLGFNEHTYYTPRVREN